MKKNSITMIALACLGGCLAVSCSTEGLDAEQPFEGTKIVIPVQGPGTKAVDVEGKATFKTSESVYVYAKSAIDSGELHPSADGASTTFTGTLSGVYKTGDHITVLYNTNSSGVVDYSGQDGSIEVVKDAGWAEDVEIVSLDAEVLTTESVKLQNLQSIFRFTFINASTSAEISGVRFVRIYSDSNKLVAAYDVLTPANSTYGPITVSRNSDLADNYIYTALRFDENPSDVIRFEVVDKDDNVYLGTKTAPAAGFANGIFYTSSVTVTPTPASKMAFRGYEVSTGILERSKSGEDPATYSLTSGAMTRIPGTMNYSLPTLCNPFEPALYYGNKTYVDKFFHRWGTLNSELGASGVDIDAASTKLPDSWHFPSAGDVSSDWSVIVFGAPISPITVNGNNVANNAYAMVTVNLEAGNPYTSGAKSCYGLLLLRDGATIPSGYLSKVGSASKYSDNPLTEEQFNDLVKMGSLFVSASGFYNKGGDKPGNTPWKEPANGHYWSTKQYNPYENYYYFGFNESGSVSATYHASNAGNYYKFVKLVKSIVD